MQRHLGAGAAAAILILTSTGLFGCPTGGADAGPDAGPARPDAGADGPDAGPTPDAGEPQPDAGPDAGPNGPDAGCSEPACGPEELCGPLYLGFDDDCDGEVDEGCDCVPGETAACFRGDPTLRETEGCIDGTMPCQPDSTWGACEGGLHAVDGCAGALTCSPLRSSPFVPVDVSAGSAAFSGDALTEVWSIECPSAISPCPAVVGNIFTPLQSGEYTVTYTKTTDAGPLQCSYPLVVGAPGLRVELTWDFEPGQDTVDLDLQLHQPQDVSPWAGAGGNEAVCAFDNCTAFTIENGVSWFDGNTPPDAVNWFLDPIFENNTCYFAPRGVGQQWQALGMGCHNPRLDTDNINCDPTVTDPQQPDFCAPENINLDFPPADQWMRLGVHYYSAHSVTYDVHPRLRIYCGGQLRADLGAMGFDAPVTFTPADDGVGFWLAADVRFPAPDDPCAPPPACEIRPLYADDVALTPFMSTTTVVSQSFGPAYAP